MKLFSKLLVLLCALVMAFALVSCGGGNDESKTESKSEQQSESQQQTDDKITVTFHYGVKAFDEENGTVTEYAETKVVEYVQGQSVTAPAGAAVRTDGYRALGWDTDAYKQKITKSIDVYQLYSALKKYNVTFKNTMGNDICTVIVYEGNKVAEDQIPNTAGYTVYAEADYAKLDDATKALMQEVPDLDGYYMMKADAGKVATHVALPIGTYFDRWAAAAGQGIGVAIKADAVFTVTTGNADRIVPLVPKGSIVFDGVQDAGYAAMGDTYKHVVSFGFFEGDDYKCSTSTNVGISDILNKYADFAEADAAGEGAEWQAQYDNYHRVGDIEGKLYACWDGDYIYFYVQVKDSSVATNGKTYCSINNPYENDAAEIWYSINDKYHKLCLDACGYHLWSMEGASQYLNHVINKGMYATKVYSDIDNNVTVSITADDVEPRILAQDDEDEFGTKLYSGYALEYALPAYDEPTASISETNPLGEELGGANWGTKLSSGSVLHFALQVDCISAPANTEAINYAVEGTGSIGKYLTREGHTEEDTELLNAMARWNAGWQMNAPSRYDSFKDCCLTIVLG